MKFQKTLLAASLAVAAVSTVNAAVVDQVAKPVQVTENLFNPGAVDLNGNPIYTNIDGVNGVVSAPVHSVYAKNNGVIDTDLSFTLPNGTTTSALPTITTVNDQIINLGINNVTSNTPGGADSKFDVFKYKTQDGTTVYRFQEVATGKYVDGYYTDNGTVTENGVLKTLIKAYEGNSPVNVDTLERGGQIQGTTGGTEFTGQENRQINGERVVYGYQGTTKNQLGSIDGTIVDPSAQEQYLKGPLGTLKEENDIRYVNTGILANTGTGPITDPAKNVYGVSARDNQNVTMLTGNGIALADLNAKGAKGVLHTDGSVNVVIDSNRNVSAVNKTREYNVDGLRLVEVYNDDAGRELAPSYYQIAADNTSLTKYEGSVRPAAGSHIKTGTAEDVTFIRETSKVHNTVTQKNVTYKDVVLKEDVSGVNAGITTPNANTTDVNASYQVSKEISKTEQYASAGVVGLEGKKDAYGFKVANVESTAGAVTKNEYTEITAAGINTTGVINAADYQIGGVSIVENIKGSVDEAVTGATAAFEAKVDEKVSQVDAKVAEVDEKIIEVDARLTQFNGVASGLNNRVDQLNKRVDEVEETAYRGVAIALAAQQNVPNLGAGQTAVFGGVGHYESESAFAMGLATVLKDGRTSFSGALGVAGGSEIGGRVGVAYVFGGK